MLSDPLAARQTRADPLDVIWHYGSGAIATVSLLLLLAVTLALAAVFPQRPAGLNGTALEYWLATTSAAYGSVGSTLRAAGAFEIFTGLWLRLVLALLSFHCLLRLAAAARTAWHAWRGPAQPLPPPLPALAVPLGMGAAEAACQAESALRAARYAVPAPLSIPTTYIVVHGLRRRAAVAGPVLAYLGATLILLALFIDGVSGWTAESIALAPGNAAVGPGETGTGPVQVALEAIGGPDARPVSTVLLSRSAGPAARASVGANRPAFWGAIWLAQRTTGPALAVTGVDSAGRPVLLQSSDPGGHIGQAAHVLFTATQTEQVFTAPARNTAFRVVNYPALPERGIPEPVFLVEAYRGNDPTPAMSQLIQKPDALTLDGVSYTFQPERHAVLSLAYVPGMAPLALGALLALAGAVVCLWWGNAKTWITVTERRGQTQAQVRTAALLEGERQQAEVAGLLRPSAFAGPALGAVEALELPAGNGPA